MSSLAQVFEDLQNSRNPEAALYQDAMNAAKESLVHSTRPISPLQARLAVQGFLHNRQYRDAVNLIGKIPTSQIESQNQLAAGFSSFVKDKCLSEDLAELLQAYEQAKNPIVGHKIDAWFAQGLTEALREKNFLNKLDKFSEKAKAHPEFFRKLAAAIHISTKDAVLQDDQDYLKSLKKKAAEYPISEAAFGEGVAEGVEASVEAELFAHALDQLKFLADDVKLLEKHAEGFGKAVPRLVSRKPSVAGVLLATVERTVEAFQGTIDLGVVQRKTLQGLENSIGILLAEREYSVATEVASSIDNRNKMPEDITKTFENHAQRLVRDGLKGQQGCVSLTRFADLMSALEKAPEEVVAAVTAHYADALDAAQKIQSLEGQDTVIRLAKAGYKLASTQPGVRRVLEYRGVRFSEDSVQQSALERPRIRALG